MILGWIGAQGYLQRPSKQELETVFGTHNDNDIVEIILTKGKVQTSTSELKFAGKDSQ